MSVMVTLNTNKDEIMKLIEEAKRAALEQIGAKVEEDACAAAPVDSGDLKESISHQVDRDTVTVGSTAPYAPFVELGHTRQPGDYVPSKGKRLKASFVPGQPFLGPAMEMAQGEAERIFQEELKKRFG